MGLGMKRLIGTLCSVFATVTAASAADVPVATTTSVTTSESTWSVTFASEVRYFSWKSDRGFPPGSASADFRGRGSELYIPYTVQLVGQPNDNIKIEILGRGGWVRARQSTADKSGEVETTTDTVASATATYLGFNGVQPFASVNINFPTGKSALFGSAANARMDADLVDIASFGEGFNIGPTVGFSLPITSNLIATVSAGYTRRGTFTREGPPSPPNPAPVAPTIDPGDTVTVTGSIGYQMGQLAGEITGTVSGETDTRVNGEALYRAGMRFLASGTWSYTWPETWGVTTLTASASHANKNKVLFVLPATPSFDTEPFNSNSNLYRVGLEHLFSFGKLWAGPTGSYLYRDHNGYDSNTLQFVSAKERWSTGLLASYVASERVTFNARAEHVWVHEHQSYRDNPFSVLAGGAIIVTQGVPAISSTGWQFAAGANARF